MHFFHPPNMNAIMGSVEKRHYGIASSVTATMRSLGMTASMAVATVTISICIGRNEIAAETFPALLETMRICFTIFHRALLLRYRGFPFTRKGK